MLICFTGTVIMSCGVNVKVVTNLKPPPNAKSNIIPVISWRRAISAPDDTMLRRKLVEVTDGVLDPLIAVSWSTSLSVYLVRVKTKQIVSPNRDLEFIPLSDYTMLHPIKGKNQIFPIFVLKGKFSGVDQACPHRFSCVTFF